MSPQDFAAKVRTKYPGVYDHLADEELTQKVVTKYPQYGGQVQLSSGVQRPNVNMHPSFMVGPADDDATPKGPVQTALGMANSAAQSIGDMSAPVLGHRLMQKAGIVKNKADLYPGESPLQDIPRRAAMTMGPVLAGGIDSPEPTPATPAPRPSLAEAANPGRLVRLVRQGVKEIPGYGKASRMYDAWKDPEPAQLPASPQTQIVKMGGRPVEEITDRPSGRLVLSPEEAQAEAGQMRLAKKMASQRGMQYAAGQKPAD